MPQFNRKATLSPTSVGDFLFLLFLLFSHFFIKGKGKTQISANIEGAAPDRQLFSLNYSLTWAYVVKQTHAWKTHGDLPRPVCVNHLRNYLK